MSTFINDMINKAKEKNIRLAFPDAEDVRSIEASIYFSPLKIGITIEIFGVAIELLK